MDYRRESSVLHPGTQTIIGIKVPWYEPFEVETKYYGTYKVQLASVSLEESTVIQIAAFPVRTKRTPATDLRQLCGLSGGFETQVQAIHGWEKGFVVVALEHRETAEIAAALVKTMLKKKQAEHMRYAI
jgi:hypothetical protein